MLTRNELSFIEGAATRYIDDMFFRPDTHIVVSSPLHAGLQRPIVAFDEVDRAAQKIAPAPLLRESIDLIEKSGGQRLAHK